MSKLMCFAISAFWVSLVLALSALANLAFLPWAMGFLLLSVMLFAVDDVLDVETREFERTGKIE